MYLKRFFLISAIFASGLPASAFNPVAEFDQSVYDRLQSYACKIYDFKWISAGVDAASSSSVKIHPKRCATSADLVMLLDQALKLRQPQQDVCFGNKNTKDREEISSIRTTLLENLNTQKSDIQQLLNYCLDSKNEINKLNNTINVLNEKINLLSKLNQENVANIESVQNQITVSQIVLPTAEIETVQSFNRFLEDQNKSLEKRYNQLLEETMILQQQANESNCYEGDDEENNSISSNFSRLSHITTRSNQSLFSVTSRRSRSMIAHLSVLDCLSALHKWVCEGYVQGSCILASQVSCHVKDDSSKICGYSYTMQNREMSLTFEYSPLMQGSVISKSVSFLATPENIIYEKVSSNYFNNNNNRIVGFSQKFIGQNKKLNPQEKKWMSNFLETGLVNQLKENFSRGSSTIMFCQKTCSVPRVITEENSKTISVELKNKNSVYVLQLYDVKTAEALTIYIGNLNLEYTYPSNDQKDAPGLSRYIIQPLIAQSFVDNVENNEGKTAGLNSSEFIVNRTPKKIPPSINNDPTPLGMIPEESHS